MNTRPPEYFKHFVAWRSAFFAMMEAEQPNELPMHARENLGGWVYRSPQPTDKYPHVQRKYTTPKFP